MRRYGERAALDGVTFALPGGHDARRCSARTAPARRTLLRVLATLLRPHAGSVSVLGAQLPREAWKVRGRSATSGTSRCSTAS